ncbi:cupredoxin family copper-binding protein [Pandoraea sputorum]|uniref:cupredoxin domain-containing protein n=1 Tax=Pandoraea sputorum TaxID=93222 RepID=UPI001E611926|nr:cupredoxin family copper-binding protein [Pandoraea sputorum]MCE4059735.1 cupredoxin family copper-binding protein [Pandoraea sputorum]
MKSSSLFSSSLSSGLNRHSAQRRTLLAGLAVAATGMLVLAGRAEAAAATTDPGAVHIDNFTFSPATLTVKAGTRVTWTNRDDEPHTVTSSSNPRTFASGALDTDGTFAFTFDKPGTYPYYCAIHPHMTGVIVVK